MCIKKTLCVFQDQKHHPEKKKKNYNVSTVGIFELYDDSSAIFLRKKHEHPVFMVPMGLGSRQMVASVCNSERFV